MTNWIKSIKKSFPLVKRQTLEKKRCNCQQNIGAKREREQNLNTFNSDNLCESNDHFSQTSPSNLPEATTKKKKVTIKDKQKSKISFTSLSKKVKKRISNSSFASTSSDRTLVDDLEEDIEDSSNGDWEKEKEDLKFINFTKQNKINELTKKLEEINQEHFIEVEKAQQDYDELLSSYLNLSEKSQLENNSWQKKIKNSDWKFSQLKKEYKNLKAIYQKTKDKLAIEQQEYQNLYSLLDKEAEKVIHEREQERKKVNDKLIKFSEKCLDLIHEKNLLIQEKESLTSKLEKETKDLNTEKAEHQKTYRLYLDEEKKLKALTAKLNNQIGNVDYLNDEITRLRGIINKKETLIKTLEEENSNQEKLLNNKINLLENRLLAAEKKWEKQKTAFEDQILVLETYQKKIEQQKQNLSDLLLDKNNELDDKDNEIYQLTNELAIKNREINDINNLLTTEQTNHQITIQTLQSERDDRVIEKDNLDNQITNLTIDRDKYERDWKTERDLRLEKEQEIINLKTQLENKDLQYQELESEKQNIQTNLENKEKQIINELNNSLNLNLFEPTLSSIVTRIKELIVKAPTDDIDNDKIKQLKHLTIIREIDLVGIEKELGLELPTEIKQLKVQRNILLTLLIMNLLVLSGLITWIKKSKKRVR